MASASTESALLEDGNNTDGSRRDVRRFFCGTVILTIVQMWSHFSATPFSMTDHFSAVKIDWYN